MNATVDSGASAHVAALLGSAAVVVPGHGAHLIENQGPRGGRNEGQIGN